MKRAAGIKTFLGFLTVTLCICSVTASAATLSFELGVIFEGTGVPLDPVGPWVNATFDDGGSAGTVDLTISIPGLSGNQEKVSAVYFNLNPLLDPNLLGFSALITTDNVELSSFGIGLGQDAFQANGDGLFDILIDFNKNGQNRAFNGGETVQFTITLAGLTADSFDFPSALDGGTGQYETAAQLIGLGATQDSAWVTIPEPTTICLLGLGGLLLFRKRRA